MTRQIVNSHVDELTNSYMNGDYEVFESVVNTVFRDTDSLYADYTNKLLVYVERNFKEFNLFLNPMSNLVFDPYDVKQKGKDSFGESTEEYKMEELPEEKKGFWDFLKSQKKREQEKKERMEAEARIKNEYAQYKMQEQIRRKQEARQAAACDLDDLSRLMIDIVTTGMHEKYDYLISQIQEIDCLNKQNLENGNRQMKILREIRNEVMSIENAMV